MRLSFPQYVREDFTHYVSYDDTQRIEGAREVTLAQESFRFSLWTKYRALAAEGLVLKPRRFQYSTGTSKPRPKLEVAATLPVAIRLRRK